MSPGYANALIIILVAAAFIVCFKLVKALE